MARAYASVNCENCGNPIGGQHPGVCPSCRDMLREQEHRRKSFQAFRNPYVLVSCPGHEDLVGLNMSRVDFQQGEYSWLTGAVFQKGGREYIFDGKRARVRA